jgi:hypothetical protein
LASGADVASAIGTAPSRSRSINACKPFIGVSRPFDSSRYRPSFSRS